MGIDQELPRNHLDYLDDLTGDIRPERLEKTVAIGDKIRQLRESKGITLSSLAGMTGFDEALLSDIENKEVQPQLGTVIRLSKAMDSAFGNVISGEGDKPFSVTRKTDRKTIQRSTGKKGKQHLYSYKSLAADVKGRHMEALMVTLAENPEGAVSLHDGEEFIYVLEGSVTAKIGEDHVILAPGDSIYYHSATPHLLAAEKGTATILAVIYAVE
ncbi:MAG: XRE family transcriptional regulator [Desulfobacterales bacterium]|jgi:quercetin dioxygenase-like cupin family protein|nr:XRE family transcriptional regulator [Desulfobacterales bacterium]